MRRNEEERAYDEENGEGTYAKPQEILKEIENQWAALQCGMAHAVDLEKGRRLQREYDELRRAKEEGGE